MALWPEKELTRSRGYKTLPHLRQSSTPQAYPTNRTRYTTFDRISNAIAHELYDKIAESLMDIVNKSDVWTMFSKVNRNIIDQVLDELKKKKIKKKRIRKIEMDYIKRLTDRALTYQPYLKVKTLD
eukprot:132458_1